jgi:aspartyl-tRNA(Asn)/glutamyl-tRNA(Gln) amidotransferase subunit B
MEKGNLRCDVNISLREKESDPLGAKVELKNLNSFSAIRRAIHFEIARQTEELGMGIPQIQSTRRWNDDLGETQLMRTKEDAHDYRYFPCPDLLPIATAPLLETVRPLVPEPRLGKIGRYENDFGLTAYDAAVLTADRHLAEYFEAANHPSIPAKKTANFLINNLLGTLNEQSLAIADCPVTPEKLRDLLTLVENGTLAPNQAKEVFAVLFTSPQRDVKSIADDLGFKPTSSGDLEALIDAAIAANPAEVEAIKAGNEKLLNFLTGQVMKSSSTKPNPKQVTDLLRAKLL